ncbi:hypothetical protein ZWY2020_008486, partial [Hordeum vulgare]
YEAGRRRSDGSAKLRVFLFPASGADQPASGSGSHLTAVDETGQRYIDAIKCVSADAVAAIRRRESVATAARPRTTPRPPSPPASRKSLGFSVVTSSTPAMGIPAHNPGAPDRRDGRKEPLGSSIGFPSCSRIHGRVRRGQPGRCSSVVQGDHVDEFQQLCEVQSDKATIEITSCFRGTVHQIQFAPRDIVKVGEQIQEFSVVGKYDDPLDPAGCLLDLAAIHAREEAALSAAASIFFFWQDKAPWLSMATVPTILIQEIDEATGKDRIRMDVYFT